MTYPIKELPVKKGACLKRRQWYQFGAFRAIEPWPNEVCMWGFSASGDSIISFLARQWNKKVTGES